MKIKTLKIKKPSEVGTLSVTVKISRRFKLRLKLATFFLKMAAHAFGGADVKVEIS